MVQTEDSTTSCGASAPASSPTYTNEWFSLQQKKYTNNTNKVKVSSLYIHRFKFIHKMSTQ